MDLFVFIFLPLDEICQGQQAVLVYILCQFCSLSCPSLTDLLEILNFFCERTNPEGPRVAFGADSFKSHCIGEFCLNPVAEHVTNILSFFLAQLIEFLLLLIVFVQRMQILRMNMNIFSL